MIRSAVAGNEELLPLINRQIYFALAGIVLIFIVAAIDYRYWMALYRPIFIVISILLISLYLSAQAVFGAARWFQVGVLFVQPTEFAKIASILLLARYFDNSENQPRTLRWLLFAFLWTMGLAIWIFHLGLAVASSYVAFLIRFDGIIPPHYAALFKDSLPALLVARGAMFIAFRLYEGLWRYTSVRDVLNILLTVTLSSLGFLLFIEEAIGLTHYPRSILLIDALLLTGFSAGVRLIARAHRDLVAGTGGRKVLIYGAGDAGDAQARDEQEAREEGLCQHAQKGQGRDDRVGHGVVTRLRSRARSRGDQSATTASRW